MYGQILQDVDVAVPNVTVPHNLGTNDFCAFLIQDVTSGGLPVGTSRVFPSVKTSTSLRIDNAGGLGNMTADVVLVSGHSVLDVGPVMNGPTRTTAQVRRGRSPSYRSLHRNVVFDSPAAPVLFFDVTVTHLLGLTEDPLVFIQPNADPWAGVEFRFFTQSIPDGNSVVVRCEREDGAAFAKITKPCDIMVLSRPTTGHNVVFPPHRATGVNAGQPSCDYDGAELGRATAGTSPSYWVGYFNVDGIVKTGKNVVHNLGQTPLTALVGTTANAGSAKLRILNRAQSSSEIQLSVSGGTIDDAQVLVLTSHSMVNKQ